MSSRSFGWKEDQGIVEGAESLTAVIRRPGRARGTRPSLKHLRKQRLYQDGFGACVAFSEARGIHMSLLHQGVSDAPVPSPLHLYFNGRAQEYAGTDADKRPPLEDRGMYPSKALRATQQLGFVAWDDFPYGAPLAQHNEVNAGFAHIWTEPPPKVDRLAFDQEGLRWFDIPPKGRMDAIEDCYAQGLPVLLALDCDRPFCDIRSSEPIKSLDPNDKIGGHMLCGLEVTSDGHWLIDNWWEDWGFEDGFGILHRDLVESYAVRNVVALLPVPTYA